MDCIRKIGLHPRLEDVIPGSMGLSSLGGMLTEPSGGRAIVSRGLPGHDTWDTLGDADENNSVSSGGLSPDLGDTWKYGCPKSVDWDSGIDVRG